MGFEKQKVNRRTCNEGGFTLIEILIAISIFMVGILAIGSMQVAALRSNASSMGVTEAINIAQAHMERLQSIRLNPSAPDPLLDEAQNGTANHRDTVVSQGDTYNVTWVTNSRDLDGNGAADSVEATVTVSWGDMRMTRSISIFSIIIAPL
jgi:prepilin-type N-terminal cleavage/methylation domain-containing protein